MNVCNRTTEILQFSPPQRFFLNCKVCLVWWRPCTRVIHYLTKWGLELIAEMRFTGWDSNHLRGWTYCRRLNKNDGNSFFGTKIPIFWHIQSSTREEWSKWAMEDHSTRFEFNSNDPLVAPRRDFFRNSLHFNLPAELHQQWNTFENRLGHISDDCAFFSLLAGLCWIASLLIWPPAACQHSQPLQPQQETRILSTSTGHWLVGVWLAWPLGKTEEGADSMHPAGWSRLP